MSLRHSKRAEAEPFGPSVLSRAIAATVALALLALTGCAVHSLLVASLEKEPQSITSPVKVHRIDGSVVVFRDGVTIDEEQVTAHGTGLHYDIRLENPKAVTTVALDEVAAMESFSTPVHVAGSVLGTVIGGTASVIGGVVLAFIIFGSCPTVYSDAAGGTLQAELFSYSIAPLLADRDVDRLDIAPDEDGRLRLDVRNEALETHYIDHLEILEARHAPGETVLNDDAGRFLALREIRSAERATARNGGDRTSAVATSDGVVAGSDPDTLRTASGEDPEDYLDLEFAAPPPDDSAILVLRLRSSLFTTVLFYDVMLANQGAGALEWLAEDLADVTAARAFESWCREHFELRVSVMDGGAYREVASVTGPGPIAWEELAIEIPVPAGDTLQVRLTFTADNWRFDRIGLADSFRVIEARVIELAAVEDSNGVRDPHAASDLREADDRHVVTTPGQRFFALFEVGQESAGERTFFLAARGYYTEWIRRDWLQRGRHGQFQPGAKALEDALRRWESERDSMEERFFATRIPMR